MVPAQKIKIQEVSLFQCPQIVDLIFKELSFLDLMNFSQVSHEFYDLLANSTNGMNKISLVIRENWNREFMVEDVQQSTRKYAHVKIEDLLRSRTEVTKMLQLFSQSIVSIFTRFDFDLDGVKLPKMESLVIYTRRSNSYIENGLMVAAVDLKKLSLYGATCYTQDFVKCLENNTGLEELELGNSAQHHVLSLLTTEIGVGLKLKSLKVDSFRFEFCHKTFIQFLHTQIESLENFKAFELPFASMQQIFSLLTNLKCLTYSPMNSYENSHMFAMKSNPSVTELRLIGVNENLLREFIQKAPKLQKLFIAEPSWRMFDLITYCSSTLLEFKYAFFEDRYRTVEDAIKHRIKESQKYNNTNMKFTITRI